MSAYVHFMPTSLGHVGNVDVAFRNNVIDPMLMSHVEPVNFTNNSQNSVTRHRLSRIFYYVFIEPRTCKPLENSQIFPRIFCMHPFELWGLRTKSFAHLGPKWRATKRIHTSVNWLRHLFEVFNVWAELQRICSLSRSLPAVELKLVGAV